MKKLRFIVLQALMAILLLTGSMDAGATVYNWSRYDLSFETPDDGFVTFNSPTRFEVQWEDMVMTVQLYSQDKGNEKKLLTENLQRKALGYNMYDLHNGKIKVKGFKKTYSIDGTMPDGSRAIIADLVSKHQNLIVEVTVVYLYGNREIVEDMIKSFAENKKQQPNHDRKRQKVQSKQKADQEKQKAKKQQEQQQQPARKEKLYDA
ncbi:MAG: hypothetical protein IJG42_04945 [Muribaculaceae bacterium]|nr:hypothetical protein [Muribaculaceae bacterium]